MLEWFTDRARRAVKLAEEEARRLDHNYIGTEHILLGLIREGDGVAAQVLVKLGADLNRVRQQVIQLIAARPQPGHLPPREGVPVAEVRARLDAIEGQLAAIEGQLAAVEQRVGIRPDTTDLDEQIDRVRGQRQAAAAAQEYEQAAALRDREKELPASKAARQEQWAAAHPALPVLAERCQQLTGEVERLRALLRQHGIDRKTSQPDLRPSTASQPGSGPRNLHLDGTHWLEVPAVAGSLGDGRSACLTPSCPRPAPAAAVRTRAAGSRFRYDRSLPSQAIRARAVSPRRKWRD